jgi:3-methyladenine DNA glycosylase AlkC
MSSLLKDRYNQTFYEIFSNAIKQVNPSFNKKKFIKEIFDEDFENKELKGRMKHTTAVVHYYLPNNFKETAALWIDIVEVLRNQGHQGLALEFMFIPDYIETYGINHFKESVEVFEKITSFTSCEFAVRPFIIKYEDKMIQQMYKWSKHNDHHVRRLASEGSRSRLPWAIALPKFKTDPSPILPILHQLKNDSSEYVRRSVANNINDISKDNAEIVYEIIQSWKSISNETDSIIKHGSRTLLKKGDPIVLDYFNLKEKEHLKCKNFRIHQQKIRIGESIAFSFELVNNENHTCKVRLEYGIHYLRNNGTHSKKVFKISERELEPGETLFIERKQSFRVITTKQFYIGEQKLSLIINGKEKFIGSFELLEEN